MNKISISPIKSTKIRKISAIITYFLSPILLSSSKNDLSAFKREKEINSHRFIYESITRPGGKKYLYSNFESKFITNQKSNTFDKPTSATTTSSLNPSNLVPNYLTPRVIQ